MEIRLFANLKSKTPDNADRFPITPGMTVGDLMHALNIPPDETKLIFIDGVRGSLDSTLNGGERVALFPPVGGG